MKSNEVEPFEKILSENVMVLYGWADAHAVVKVRLPVPFRPWYSVQVPADAVARFKNNFQDAQDYGLKPESERTWPEPKEFEAREDCRGRYGYPDAHVELGVKRGIWIWIQFTFQELKLAKAAMDEAYGWAELPGEIRSLQGVK